MAEGAALRMPGMAPIGRDARRVGGNGLGDGVGNRAGGGIEKPEGWYYVGDGKLRYRDEKGWTAHYMSTKDPAAQKWPPPPPRTFLQQVLDDQAALGDGPTQSGRRRWFRRLKSL